jgi:hypothetical protein
MRSFRFYLRERERNAGMGSILKFTSNHCPYCYRCDHDATVRLTDKHKQMARKAGIYDVLWRPRSVGVHYARDLIAPLENAIKKMTESPSIFAKFEEEGVPYMPFLVFLKQILIVCQDEPIAKVELDGDHREET